MGGRGGSVLTTESYIIYYKKNSFWIYAYSALVHLHGYSGEAGHFASIAYAQYRDSSVPIQATLGCIGTLLGKTKNCNTDFIF